MEKNIRESEEFISFKTLLFRKGISMSEFSKRINKNRESIYRAFRENKKERIEELFKQVKGI